MKEADQPDGRPKRTFFEFDDRSRSLMTTDQIMNCLKSVPVVDSELVNQVSKSDGIKK